MNMKHFDDEILMAFADGELDDATSSQVEAALAVDEILAKRLAVFLDTRVAVAAALKPLIDEAVPDALDASVRRMLQASEKTRSGVEQDNVVSFRGREQTKTASRSWVMPVAASILAVITGVGGFMAGRDSLQRGPSYGAKLTAALDRELSGSDVALSDTEAVHIVSSFVDGRGELCREYALRREGARTATVACRANGAWVTRLALTSPRAQGYAPASSQETIDAYVASINAGEPLGADEEKRALAERK